MLKHNARLMALMCLTYLTLLGCNRDPVASKPAAEPIASKSATEPKPKRLTVRIPSFVRAETVEQKDSLEKLSTGDGLTGPLKSGDSLSHAMSLRQPMWADVWYTRQFFPSYFGRYPDPIVTVWDLGEDTNIEGVIFWQYVANQRNQLKDVSICINTHAQGSSQFAGMGSEFRVSFVGGDETNGVAPQEFRISPVVGRYVEMKFHSNYFGDQSIGEDVRGGDRVGLGEFAIVVSSAESPSVGFKDGKGMAEAKSNKPELEGVSQREDDAAENAEEGARIRYEGVYLGKDGFESGSCLRFYPDGTVIEVSIRDVDNIDDAKEIKKWFRRENKSKVAGQFTNFAIGKYKLKGKRLSFTTVANGGFRKVKYEGSVAGKRLRLNVQAPSFGTESVEYSFVGW